MTYIGLTIGPLSKTIMSAKKTRELWAASYLFSHLMKIIIKNIAAKNTSFMIPYVPDGNIDITNYKLLFEPQDTDKNGTGLFADRLVIQKQSDEDWSNLIHAIDMAKKEAVYILGEGSANFVDRYFQFYATEAELDDHEKLNPLKALNARLDALECFPSYYSDEFERDFIGDFFAKINGSKLKSLAFAKVDRGSFPTLYEIAPYALVNRLKDDEYKIFDKLCDDVSLNTLDDPIVFLKNKFQKEFKSYHNYYAIIHADGDGFGKTIEDIGVDTKKLSEFSKKVFEYSSSVGPIIKLYGGFCVYAGGDDMLAFVPLRKNNTENLLSVIESLHESFIKIMFGYDVTLSFGASITYVKFPLKEALNLSYNALDHGSKEFPKIKDKPKAKNALTLYLQKHSGQTHSVTLGFSTDSYKTFKDLLTSEIENTDTNALPHAFHHSVANYTPIINAIGENQPTEDSFAPFFRNVFNESDHQQGGKHYDSIENARHFLTSLYREKNHEKPLNEFYNALSIIKMFRGDV